jgi:hypothetical protein
MGIIQTLSTGQGYLKGGFQGFQKSGKSTTSLLLCISTVRHFGIDGPIVMFDTEAGSTYLAKMVKQLTGHELIGIRSRSFDDLMAVAQECTAQKHPVLLVDSVTHIWRELQDAYLKIVNAERKSKNLKPRSKLEFQDWNPIKTKWAAWTNWYLNSRVHVVICGRAGYEYDWSENEETGRKELVKTGIKMKTETEFGYEPSLLVEMEQEQKRDGKIEILHRATVIGDRFGMIDGRSTVFKAQHDYEKDLAAVYEFFKPHLRELTKDAHCPVNTEVKTDIAVDEQGQDEWTREKRERVILAEEIQGELLKAYPGQTKEEKQAKVEIIEKAFGTKSWTKVETLDSATLRAGLALIRQEIANSTITQEAA